MKKFLLVCGLFAMATVATFAQETRRVAILETVDRQGNVSYASKLMLRSNLAKAITNTPGYEAYDRTDMDAIMGEQDFQRTGMVSNDQIKRLGEMTGAKYVLVAEAVVVDAQNMFITAKLLDVETARTIMTDNQMMETSAKEIQRGCQLLAEKLMKPVMNSQTETASASTVTSSDKQEKTESVDLKTTSTTNTDAYKDFPAKKKEYANFLRYNCPQAYLQYSTGKKLTNGGWACLGCGMACLGAGIGLYSIYAGNHDEYGWHANEGAAGKALISVGCIATAASVPLLAIGYKKQNKAVEIYNQHCASLKSKPLSINLTAGQNGLGLALQF